jgi:thiol-disulfide isomerase/thioredoxin
MSKLLLIIILLLAAICATHASKAPQPGTSLAGLRLYDLSGKRHSLDEVKTRRVVIIWWAFWCDTWKKALPQVTDLAARGEELDCTVWTVSIDGRYTAEIKPLVEKRKIDFPVLLDDGTWTKKLDLRRVPTVMILDEQRRVIWLHEAYPGNAVIEKALRESKKGT